MRRAMWLLACLLLAPYAHAVQVRAGGEVAHAGTLRLPAGARLSDAILAAAPTSRAYATGAAWLRPSLRRAQRGAKAGLVYELRVLVGYARLQGDRRTADKLAHMLAEVRAMPVTGRQTDTQLSPRPAELSAYNPPLADGERLYYPPRPDQVRVTGAVRRDCHLTQSAARAARDYARACPPASGADGDWIYVIEPDGRIFRRGVAAWNRDPDWYLAPGAVIYVPFDARLADRAGVAGLNADMARFLATQLLPGRR